MRLKRAILVTILLATVFFALSACFPKDPFAAATKKFIDLIKNEGEPEDPFVGVCLAEVGVGDVVTSEKADGGQEFQYQLQGLDQAGWLFYLDEAPGAETLVVAWGITALAAREATLYLRAQGKRVSLFLPNTLLPVPEEYYKIIKGYKKIVIAEENLSGHFRSILFGAQSLGSGPPSVIGVNGIGKMITPEEIVAAVCRDE